MINREAGGGSKSPLETALEEYQRKLAASKVGGSGVVGNAGGAGSASGSAGGSRPAYSSPIGPNQYPPNPMSPTSYPPNALQLRGAPAFLGKMPGKSEGTGAGGTSGAGAAYPYPIGPNQYPPNPMNPSNYVPFTSQINYKPMSAEQKMAQDLASQVGIGLTNPSSTGAGTQPTTPATPAGSAPEYSSGISQATPAPVSPEVIRQAATTPQVIVQMGQSFFNEYKSLIQQSTQEGLQYLAANQAQYFAALDTAQAQITKMFQEQMGGVDPATQMALNSLRESAQEQRRTILEDLSRRWILQSGIAVEADLRLNKNQLTAEQQMLATRVSELQNRFTSSLMQFAEARLSALQRYGTEGSGIISRGGEQQLSALQNSFNQAMGSMQYDRGVFENDRAFMEGVKQFEARSAAEKKAQEAALAQASAAEQSKAQTEQTKAAGAQATAEAVRDAMSVGNREDALAFVQQPNVWGAMIAEGVDVSALLKAIQGLPSKNQGLGGTDLQSILNQR